MSRAEGELHMNDSDRARERAMDVELGRMLSAEAGPEWQQKVMAANRAGQTINAPTPPPSQTAPAPELRNALEALAALVWQIYGQKSLDAIVADNLVEPATKEQLEALAMVTRTIAPRSSPKARSDSAD
jgi:hypothetical protein